MQTFLPYSEFQKSAEVLDYRRLGKQRVEAYQILKTLKDGGGWQNHPAVLMWKGYEGALKEYGISMCLEWIRRGYRDNTIQYFLAGGIWVGQTSPTNPPWLGLPEFHASHRSNLLRKDPVHYGKFGWKESDNLPYYWPTK